MKIKALKKSRIQTDLSGCKQINCRKGVSVCIRYNPFAFFFRKQKLRLILLFIILFAPTTLAAQEQLPRPVGFVNDFSGILSSEDRGKLKALFSELENKTTAEVAVVTIDTTRPLDIETYAVNLFAEWGIGKKGQDNGILLLVAVKDRKVRIEVGYGLEGAVPDALANQIITGIIVPAFKNGDYTRGVVGGSVAIVNLIAREYDVTLAGFKDLPTAPLPPKRSPLSSLLFLLFFIMMFGLRWGFLWWAILTPGTHHRRGGFWYGSGYGGRSGGFGGGFGGFGGGFSGGGGASGGW